MGATFFLIDDIDFPDETASGAPKALVDSAKKAGAKRKYLAKGEGGFHSQISWFPAGYEVPTHMHGHDELIMLLEGSMTMLGGGPTLKPYDSMALEAGHEYGFVAGDEGMTFVTIRKAASTTVLT
jgi:hypothetical protein